MIQIQEINFPLDCMVIHHDFHDYDPKNAFNETHNLRYLNEDLLQCKFPLVDIIVDLGWYGEVALNKGEFRIYIIKSENWEIPSNIIYPKTVDETKELLSKILQYYTSIGVKDEHNNEHN